MELKRFASMLALGGMCLPLGRQNCLCCELRECVRVKNRLIIEDRDSDGECWVTARVD
jgi:hypothetical protein